MKIILFIFFLSFSKGYCKPNSVIFAGQNEFNSSITSHISRQKRFDPFTLAIITGILTIGVTFSEYVRASASDECAVTIRYRIKALKSSALYMNFKSNYDNNWNYEKINNFDSTDSTKEKVSGGRLKVIQNYAKGKFCVEGIVYSCGSQLISRNSERSVILDVATIRKAWFKKGNPRLLEVDWKRNCLWFSDRDYTSVRAIDIYPEAFTNCENSDQNCISKHIEVF